MTDELVRLTSTNTNYYNFSHAFSPALSFSDEEQWSVAVAEIFIPRSPRRNHIRILFNDGEELVNWRFYYDKSGSGSDITYIDQSVTDLVLDTLGDDMTKADILQAIFSYGFNKVVKTIKDDSTIAKAFWKDNGKTLHQRFVWEGDNLVLKGADGANGTDGWLRMSDKLYNLLGLVTNSNLSRFLYPRNTDSNSNYDFHDKLTWRLANLNTELYLYANVDWVFVNMKSTPLISSSLAPLEHLDIYSTAVSDSSPLIHVAVPFGGITIVPAIRDYKPLAKGSYDYIRTYMKLPGSSSTLRENRRLPTDDKTHVVLHFKKEKQNLRGDYRREHPTMVF